MTGAIESVAVLALTYRTMWRNCYSAPASLDDDLEQTSDGCGEITPPAPGGISLLGMIGSQALEELDWELIDAMQRHDVDVASLSRDLAEVSPERCEALLHAWPRDPRGALALDDWAEPYIGRWDDVAAAIAKLEPLTWDREQCDEMALAAAASGWWNDPTSRPMGEFRKRMPSEQMQLSICSCRESLEPSSRSAARRSPPATSASRAAR